ncbi:AAA family ATPase [Rathayibacter sp. ZW T2_19]|uniref:AAA family ATPase n=1 Tax=Rathayibacter rubneri TaxID=2950106 RepID=A0A9X2IQN9_9MICO|nr:AAA family ATPase [Rathayibacter rubneri]MCM6761410.1 AAA family ATPase [Rathayibacter rubneri]
MADATMALVDALTAHGKTVKGAGQDKWLAQCPAHPDGNPSLSIKRGRGQVLTFCFAGCTADAIAASLGWSMSDLFDDPRGINYDYKHAGKTVRTVHRTPEKRFYQRITDDSVIPLYEPTGIDLAAALAAGRDIYVTEGEKDADVLATEGVTAVSAPMGSNSWARADYTALTGRSDIYVVQDKDEAGRNRGPGLRALLAALTTGEVRIVEAAVGKDAADHITAGRGIADFVHVDAPVPEKPVDPEFEMAVEGERRYAAVKAEARRRDLEEAAGKVSGKLHPKTLGEILDTKVVHDWLVPDLLERGDRLVITGGEGSGKSHLLRQIAIAISAGVHPFEQRTLMPPRKVLVIDAENSEQQWARGARYVTSHVSRLGKGDPRSSVVVSAGIRPDLTLQSDVNEVHALLDKHKPDLLYIGPLYKLVPKGLESNDDAAQMILTLDSFRERGICLLMEAHAGHAKSLGGDRDLRPRGASALMGWPEFGFGLRPVEGDESLAIVVKWRGDREQRDWPTHLRRGTDGELPWMPAYMPHL